MEDDKKINSSSQLGRALFILAPFFVRYRLRLIGGFVALLGVDFLQLIIPRFVKRAVDQLGNDTATEEVLLHIALMVGGCALAVSFCRFGWRYLVLGFSRLLERDLRKDFFARLLTLDQVFFQKRPVGEVMALSSNDLAAVQLSCGMGLVAFVDAVIMTVAALGFMSFISFKLTLIAVLPMPVLALITRALAGRLHRRFTKVQEQFAKLTEFARSTVGNIRLIKGFNQERFQVGCFAEMGGEYVTDNIRLARIQGTLFPVSGLVGNCSLLLVLFFGGRLAISGVISIGDFVAFVSYLFMLTWPMMAIGWVANLFQRGITSLLRIDDILKAEPVLHDPAKVEKLPEVKGELAMRDVSFSYGSGDLQVLRQIDLQVKPGEFLGIVGKTGSGKSTICKLLTRMYPVKDGQLFLDGIDINHLHLADYRRSIAYVSQVVTLFSETIAANIAMGEPGVDQARVEEAARVCAVHEEIMALPQGYQTRIGEKGIKLSGGQRQRIALARALLLDRPILIIDDALSAVDLGTENIILEGLRGFRKDHTCIVVSHRIAPLNGADEIVVLEKGRITDRGDHQEMLKTNEYYRLIYEHQSVAWQGRN